MKQSKLRTISVFLFLSLIFTFSSFKKNPDAQKPPKIRTIIIDPGHGGIDPGAKGLTSHEADVALDISLKLGNAIQKEFPDIKVVFTRTSDILPGNGDDIHEALRVRADMANKARGDLFVSIHCNANGQPAGGFYAKRVVGHKNVYKYVGKGSKKKKKLVKEPIYEAYWVKNTRIGTQTYIWAADRSGPKGGSINDRGDEGGEDVEDSTNILDLNTPEAKIRAQLYEKKYFDNSALLASYVEDEFSKSGRKSDGVMQRNNKGIWVLQATGMPSILIETGFITNKEEEEYLNSDKGQSEIVDNIIAALKRYKDDIENSHAPGGAIGGFH
ncbi:MAG: N-acetylmuramoyl-L-alanine amidase [Bacteroidetes bacterium]|nr:MAG: N-acetylmuramoyl-L-alanine amidase [Bacteroidota bacterium]